MNSDVYSSNYQHDFLVITSPNPKVMAFEYQASRGGDMACLDQKTQWRSAISNKRFSAIMASEASKWCHR